MSPPLAQDVLIEQRAALVRRSAAGVPVTPQSVRAASGQASPHSELVDALVEYAHVVYGPGCRYTKAGERCPNRRCCPRIVRPAKGIQGSKCRRTPCARVLVSDGALQ